MKQSLDSTVLNLHDSKVEQAKIPVRMEYSQNMKRLEKIVLASYSLAGGPGGVQRSLAAEFRRLGATTTELYRVSSSLREELSGNVRQVFLASLDAYFVRDPKFGSAISLFRNSSKNLFRPGAYFEYAVLGWLPGLLTNADFHSLAQTPTLIRVPDENVFTGVCHYSIKCEGHTSGCTSCPAVRSFIQSAVPVSLTRKIETYDALKRLIFVCPSNWIANKAESSLALRGRAIQVIRNPIDRVFFQKKTSPGKSQIFTVLFVASQVFDPVKGFNVLAPKLDMLAKSGGIQVRVVGNPGRRAGQFPSIKFLGRLNASELSNEYKKAWVTIVPSKSEASGNVVGESLASGTPVLVRDIDGLGEVASEVDLELLFSEDDELIEKLLMLDFSRYHKRTEFLGQIANQHHPGVVAEQYFKLLKSL